MTLEKRNHNNSVVTIYVGKNAVIHAEAEIGVGAKIGAEAEIGTWVVFHEGADIGAGVKIGKGVVTRARL